MKTDDDENGGDDEKILVQFRVKRGVFDVLAALAEAAGDVGVGPYMRRVAIERANSQSTKKRKRRG